MSNSTIAIEPRFIFACSELDASTFEVARFSGNDSISCPYRFDITLISEDKQIEGDSVVNKPASLFLKRDDEMYPYSGIITSFKYLETTS